MPTGAPINMLWIGPRLSALERLSIMSFLGNGHPVRLFTYGDVEAIPPGVEHHDGREILPAASVFTYADGFGKGSYGGFANLFRYKLLLDHGGIWSDTDTVCLKPFDFEAEYVIGRERKPPDPATGARNERLAIGVLKVPPNSRVMLECYAIADEANRAELRWGETGPELATKRFMRHGLEVHALPPDAFYPVDWWNMQDLVTKPLAVGPETYAVHFWNEVWRFKALDKDADYPADCAYETLKRRYGVHRT
jgi:hypothetical protein